MRGQARVPGRGSVGWEGPAAETGTIQSRGAGQPHSLGCWGMGTGGQIQALPPELVEEERGSELDTSVEMTQSVEEGDLRKARGAPETSKRQALLTQEEENDIES